VVRARAGYPQERRHPAVRPGGPAAGVAARQRASAARAWSRLGAPARRGGSLADLPADVRDPRHRLPDSDGAGRADLRVRLVRGACLGDRHPEPGGHRRRPAPLAGLVAHGAGGDPRRRRAAATFHQTQPDAEAHARHPALTCSSIVTGDIPMRRLMIAFAALAFALPLQAAPETFTIDKGHTFINFKVSHIGFSWLPGRFTDFDGTLVYDEANPANSKVEFTVNMPSLNTD